MTRSTLLQLLAHPTALTGADVRELEQLAQAFPYCQTAHLLLAKAAHDQGSMLAGQRLRRAATYATDRARLRQLIELVPPVAEPELALATVEAVATDGTDSAQPASTAAPIATQLSSAAEAVVAAPEPVLLEVEHAVLPGVEALANEPMPEEELPPSAPPIRPPAEAETARLEFGLADAEPAEITAYQLPGLTELVISPASAADNQALVSPPPVFSGVADVGYAPGEGSRLGFCLQGVSEEYSLAAGPAALLPGTKLPPAGEFFAPDALLLAHLAAQQTPVVPGAPLIAVDLIDSFLRRGSQAGSRRRPMPPMPDAEEEEQPDLSGPSTRAVPDLASENLAKILARQGKPDRAIAIYERLMVKHPEKMAYFAAQIDSLRPQA